MYTAGDGRAHAKEIWLEQPDDSIRGCFPLLKQRAPTQLTNPEPGGSPRIYAGAGALQRSSAPETGLNFDLAL
jgi:hypothetical protein